MDKPSIIKKKYIGDIARIMEKKMETLGPFKGMYMVTLGFYCGHIGIMEKNMDTTMARWGYSRDNGEENGNYYGILGLE